MNMQSDRISTVFDIEISFRVVIPEREEEVARLLERNNWVWYIDGSKKDVGTGMELFKIRIEESVSMNPGSHATAFQTEVITISTMCCNHGTEWMLTQKNLYYD